MGAAAALAGCAPRASVPAATPAPAPCDLRVLVLSTTRGFRHDSIPAAVESLRSVGQQRRIAVDHTEDTAAISASNLAGYAAVCFCLTSGELPLDPSQRTALISFVEKGGGFLGFHSATDTNYEWLEYGRLVGAYFKEHPWTQAARVRIEDAAFPGASGASSLELLEEYYTFRENPRPRVNVIVSLDASSVGASGDYPLAWWSAFGSGRSYYNALGHFSDTWRRPDFRAQLAGALWWATGRTDCAASRLAIPGLLVARPA